MDTLIVLADKLAAKTSHGTYEPFHNWKIFWENSGEDDIKFPKEYNGRMDPLSKLYKGCQLMLVLNNNVRHGEANRTTVTLISVCLKPNIIPIQIIIGKLQVKAVYALQVISIVLKHNNPKIIPNTFQLEPIEFCITTRILKPKLLQMKEDNEMVKMKATQLPVISNQATTGHKLQGASLNQLFVNNWNYTTNWPDIVLSRLQSSEGLYLCNKLSTDLTKYSLPWELQKMIQQLEKRAPTFWTQEQYEDLFNHG